MNIINMIINIVLMVVIYWNIYTCFSRYIDYKNTDKNSYDIKYNKMEYHKSIIGVIISIIASITIKPENFDLNIGANYAQIKAEDKIWEGLGFVLQWAKYGLKE